MNGRAKTETMACPLSSQRMWRIGVKKCDENKFATYI